MKILVPVDGSDISTRALKHALALAKAFAKPCRIVVVAVDDALFPGVERKIGAKAAREHHAANFARMFAPAKKAVERSRTDAAFVEIVDDVASGILKTAGKEKSDLIVMGSRGNGSIKGALLGSVSLKVLANSKVPVTIVR